MSDDQWWVDEVVYYRNLAIMHGATPEEMRNDFDRDLAERGISTERDETNRDYQSADERREVMDLWDTNERLEAERDRLEKVLTQEAAEVARLRDKIRDLNTDLINLSDDRDRLREDLAECRRAFRNRVGDAWKRRALEGTSE